MTGIIEASSIRDADQYTDLLRPVGRMTVTGRGPFRAELARLRLGDLMLQDVDISQPLVAELTMPMQAVFGFGNATEPSEAWDGQMLQPEDLIAHRPGQSMRLAGRGGPWGSLTLPSNRLEQAADTLLDFPLPSTRQGWRMMTPQPGALAMLRRLHADAFRLARSQPAILSAGPAAAALGESLTAALLDCLGTGQPRVDLSGGRRGRIMRRLEAVLDANADRPIAQSELCRAIGVPGRTLQTICQEMFGLSPLRYLRLRRMEMTRRALLAADPRDPAATVTEIATRHGFWELGRFAVAYRAQFGESPSATLNRSPRVDWKAAA